MAVSAAQLCARWRAMYRSPHGYLEEADPLQHDTFDIVLFAVTESGDNLEFASDRLRDHETIVRTAIASCPYALQFASVRLRESYDVGILAIMADPMSFKYAGYELKGDARFVMHALAGNVRNIVSMSVSLGGLNGRLRQYIDAHRLEHAQYVMAGWRVLINMSRAGVPVDILLELQKNLWPERHLWSVAAAAHDNLESCGL